MTKKLTTIIIIISLTILAAGAAGYWTYRFLSKSPEKTATITNFEECATAGYPIMESYPPQCRIPDGKTFVEESCVEKETEEIMTLSDAKEIAKNSECGNRLKENAVCNEFTGTWWLDLDLEKEGCNPACVIDLKTREAEINWRCTGLNPPTDSL